MTQSSPPNKKNAKRPLWLRLFRWTLFTVTGLILLLGLIWTGLQTRWAKNYLVNFVSSATANTDDYRVTLRGLDGRLPFSITVDQITISDKKGPWLKAEKIDFAMEPLALISGLVDVKWFRMEHLSLSRFPESREPVSKKEAPPAKNKTFFLPRIRVREIRFQRIDLGDQPAGRPMCFNLQSSVKTAGHRIQAEASLKDLNRNDGGLKFKAVYDLKTEYLTADAAYNESAGGLAAGLLGLKDLTGIRLSANAQGPVSRIKGHLNLDMGGYGNAALQYIVRNPDALTLQLDGQIRAESRIVPTRVARILDSETVELTCRASLSKKKEVLLKTFRIKNGNTIITLEGNADLEQEKMDLRARIEGIPSAPFLTGTGISLKDPGPVNISASGPFMSPGIKVSTALAGLQAPGATLNDITFQARAFFKKGFTGLKSASVALTSREIRIQQTPRLKGPLKVAFQGRSPDFYMWRVKALDMTSPEVTVRVKKALIDISKGRFSGDLRVQTDHIALILPPETPPVDGRLSLNARVKGTGPENLTAHLNMAVSRLSGLPPEVAAIAGPKVTLETRAEMKGDRLTLETVVLKGSRTRLTAEGWLNPKECAFHMAYRMILDHTDGDPAMKTLPVGHVQSRGIISGKFNDFSTHVELTSRSLRLKNIDIKGMEAQLEAKGLPQKPSGTIHIKAETMDQPLSLNSDFAWTGKSLSIGKAHAQLPGIELTASLDLPPGTEDFSGKLKGRITSLEILQALTGVDAHGTGEFRIEAGSPGKSKEGPSITLDADFKDLKYRNYGASTLKVKARVDHVKTMRGRASLEATDMPLGNSRIETLKLTATGDPAGAEVTFETRGVTKTTTEAPLFLSTKLWVKQTDPWQFRLDALKAGYEDLEITLQKPATVTYGDDGKIVLDDLNLTTDKGRLRATAKLEKENVEASVRIIDLPLSLLEPFVGQDLSGSAEVGLELSGPLADPEVSVGIHIKEYNIMGRDGTRPMLMDAKLHSRRDGDRLSADLELSGFGKTPFTAGGSIPAHISLKPFAFDVNRSGRLEGKLQGKFDLVVLETLPAMEGQRFRGKMDVDMGMGGSLEKWDLNGGVTISDGRYENVEQGVLLDNIQGRLGAEGRLLKLIRLTATDGNSGAISLQGRTSVDPPFQTEIALTMKQATLLRQETLTVTADGNLNVKGDKNRMDLTGEIDLGCTEIAIPKRFPPDVTVIPVTFVNDAAIPSKEPETGKDGTKIQINLDVNIPDKFFVRGRGLDTEFKGKLTVRGPAENPVIRGTLNVVRGTFQCLSRTFKVTSGQISFDGSTPPVPFLNINTRVNAGEITAQVDISGPADAFKLTLSSHPPLPQDEIMAQILFGQSVAKLNTFQALQLAYSVNELAGGYGPDVMGKTRSFLGLDRLGFSGGDQENKSKNNDSDNNNGPSITLGKYVTDRVYVGVEQDLTDNKQDVIVEVNITPNFIIESKAGTKSGAGLGFNWNYDY